MNHALEIILSIVNTPAFITLAATVVAIILTKVYKAKPAWVKYEGTIQAAIRWAEKTIPDDSENTGVRRLDEALKYTLRVFTERESRAATAKEVAEIAEGIQIIHADNE